jgi:hypothetical protein
VLAFFSLTQAIFAPLGGCGALLAAPSLILVGVCINAIPDVRDHYRDKRRKRNRGFEPIVNSTLPTMSNVRPPPPARGDAGRRK